MHAHPGLRAANRGYREGNTHVLPGADGGTVLGRGHRGDAGNGLTPILARLRIFLNYGIGTS